MQSESPEGLLFIITESRETPKRQLGHLSINEQSTDWACSAHFPLQRHGSVLSPLWEPGGISAVLASPLSVLPASLWPLS